MFQEEFYNDNQTRTVNAEAGLWDEEDVFTHPHPVIRKWVNEYIESRITWQDTLIMIFKDINTTHPDIRIFKQQYIDGILTYEEFLIERISLVFAREIRQEEFSLVAS